MTGLYKTNAPIIRELQARIHSTVKRRHEGDGPFGEWKAACAEFHARYDELAFPGGYCRALELLASQDASTVESALQFIEIRPYFFRSQYMRTKLIRVLKRLSLTERQRDRLVAALHSDR